MLENGTSSVMHSSISMANEYVSEWVVGWRLLFSMSSGAAYLTIVAGDDTVPEFVYLFAPSITFAIPKSQICGSPLPFRGQLPKICGWGGDVEFTS